MSKGKKKFNIPGSVIIIPMFIGLLINTFVPQVLQIGGFTTALVKGTGPLVGAFLVVTGAGISLKSTPKAILRGGVMIIVKILFAVAFGLLVAFKLNDNFLGLSSLAIIGAISVANNAMYAGIMTEYGDEVDRGAVGITTMSVGPTVTMLALTSAGIANIGVAEIIGSILPLVIGIIIGNFFPSLKQKLSSGGAAITMLVGFALGANMSLGQILEGGFPGILLGVITAVVGTIITVPLVRLTGGSGTSGAAISSTAASAVATPAALAATDAKFASLVGIATSQITASVIVTSLLTPFLTSLVAKRYAKDVKSK